MNGNILYYPTIEIQSDSWLKAALCVWDRVYRIVPPSYSPNDSDEAKEAIDADLIRNIHLTKEDLAECAEEFISFWRNVPMIPDGSQYVENVRLFEDKVDQRLLPVLRSLSAKLPKDGILRLPKQTADTYMLFLAEVVSRRRNIEKITDNRDVFSLMHYFANDGNFEEYLCNPEAAEASIAITLPAIIPGGLDYVAMKEVLKFRAKYEEARQAFRESVANFSVQLSKVEDEQHTRELIQDFERDLRHQNMGWRENIQQEALHAGAIFLSVGVPTALTALGTIVTAGGSIRDNPTMIGTVAVGCVATMAEVVRSRRAKWSRQDAFYYAQLTKAFGPGPYTMTIPRYDRILDEFIND